MTKSATFPVSKVPLRSSSNEAYAPLAEYARNASSGESREQPNRKVALRPLECPAHLLDHVGAGEQISLAGVMLADDMARPVEAFLPGVGGGPTARVDEAHLAPGGLLVGLHEALQDILRRDALFHHAEGLRPEGRVRVGLRRDRADPRLRERDHGADGDESRLDRDAEIFRLRIESDDAEGRWDRRAHRPVIERSLFPGSRNP